MSNTPNLLAADSFAEKTNLEQVIDSAASFQPPSTPLTVVEQAFVYPIQKPIIFSHLENPPSQKVYGYVYLLTNQIDGKQYVGQHKSGNFDSNYWGSGKYIKSAIKKYGLRCFTRKVLSWAVDKFELNVQEIYWITLLGTCGLGYNLTIGGDGGDTYSQLPLDQMIKIIQKIRDSFTPERRNQLSKQMINRIINGQHPMLGRHHTEESKVKMRENHPDVSGSNHPLYGVPCSPERKLKISQANTGRIPTQEQLKKMREHSWKKRGTPPPALGHIHTEETKAKISQKLSGSNHPSWGVPCSPERKLKISQSLMGKMVGGVHPNAKAVVQLTLGGQFVREYPFLGGVAVNGFDSNCVGLCCRGKQQQHKGYRWVYKSNWEGL